MDYPLKTITQLRPQLQALRRKRGLTQAQLGAAIGVTQARIVEIEANPGVVSLQQILQILRVLDAELVIHETTPAPPAEPAPAPPASPKRGQW